MHTGLPCGTRLVIVYTAISHDTLLGRHLGWAATILMGFDSRLGSGRLLPGGGVGNLDSKLPENGVDSRHDSDSGVGIAHL